MLRRKMAYTENKLGVCSHQGFSEVKGDNMGERCQKQVELLWI